jgi:hemoglobin
MRLAARPLRTATLRAVLPLFPVLALVTLEVGTISLGVGGVGCGAKKPPLTEPAVSEITTDAGAPEPVDAAPPPPKSLYDRLGGKDGVAAVVDTFSKNLLVDPRVSKPFLKSKDHLEHFKQMLADMICEAAAGGCHYAGRSMRDSHKGMAISEAQFDAVVEDLQLALDERGVGETEKSELFAAIAPMRDDIVEKKKKK